MSNKTSILLIEDNVGQRRTLFDILKARGFEMFVAENGAEGLPC
jgi:DNA-binding response OmpR family regulator